MGLSTARVLQEQDFRDISSTRELQVGAYAETPDGRGYRYSLAGGTTLAPGKLCVAATVDTNVTNIAVTAASAVGSNQVSFTALGTITANTYQDGYLTVNDATGEGISYLVANHNGGTALVVNLVDPIKVALVASTSEVSLTQNPWSGAVISVADGADMPIGVPNVSITNAYYGWIQTKGVCSVLADETIAVGSAVVTGSSTVGAVETYNTTQTTQIVGTAIVAGVDTEYREVYLSID